MSSFACSRPKIDNTCPSGGGGGSAGIVVQVSLPDNATTRVNIPSTLMQGTYLFLVKSVALNGATANISATSSQNAVAGSINRLTESKALTDERVQIDWQPNQVPQLYHQVVKTGGVGALIIYNVTILLQT